MTVPRKPVGAVVLGPVSAAAVRPLRAAVLRPDRPVDESVFPGDDDPRARHLALRLGGAGGDIVAVGSLLPDAPPWLGGDAPGSGGDGPPWRIRGMATHPDHRGRGHGARVLAALLEAVAATGGGLVWCNARITATSLYRRADFEEIGEVFEVPGIGPHQAMQRTLPSTART
ncbi:MAG: GNAT family N-acetyltransferase [Acidimicrobiales bacterium]